jgi:phosphinothricin acetyltransferase
MSGELLIRGSRDADVASVTAIYTYHVLHGVASFEETPPTVEEMTRRRGELLARGLPYLVAEREVGGGVGRALLAQVLERSAALGYRQMIAVIGGADTLPSIRLHEALGFTHIGVMTGIGFKFGRWIDSVLMQRALGPGNTALPG